MKREIPCIRHGGPAGQDETVCAALMKAVADTAEVEEKLVSLVDYDGVLWVTWREHVSRTRHRDVLDAAWKDEHAGRATRHLVPSDDDYDYQDDCINNADAPDIGV